MKDKIKMILWWLTKAVLSSCVVLFAAGVIGLLGTWGLDSLAGVSFVYGVPVVAGVLASLGIVGIYLTRPESGVTDERLHRRFANLLVNVFAGLKNRLREKAERVTQKVEEATSLLEDTKLKNGRNAKVFVDTETNFAGANANVNEPKSRRQPETRKAKIVVYWNKEFFESKREKKEESVYALQR